VRALGAELDVVKSVEGRPRVTPKDIENMVARAGELAAQPGHYATDQFNNPYPAPRYRDGLAREIWDQTPVNTGARLESLAPAGGVLIGSETYEQLPDGAVVEARSGLRVKGKQDALDAYVLFALP
jgi:cysteine synthase